MKKLFNFLFVFVVAIAMVACGTSESVKKDLKAPATGGVSLTLDIAKIFVNQSSTPIVDEMTVTILKETEIANNYSIVKQVTVDVTNNEAKATVDEIEAGNYKVSITLKSQGVEVAYGLSSAKVVAGTISKVYVFPYFPGEEPPVDPTTGAVDLEVLFDLPMGDTDFSDTDVNKLNAYFEEMFNDVPTEITLLSHSAGLFDSKTYVMEMTYTEVGVTYNIQGKYVIKDGYVFEAFYIDGKLENMSIYFDLDEALAPYEESAPSMFSRN